MANLALVPDDLSDEQVLVCPYTTGFGGVGSAGIRIGDTGAVFTQGPIGLCATAGAKLSGAGVVIGVDRLPARAASGRHIVQRRRVLHRSEDASASSCAIGAPMLNYAMLILHQKDARFSAQDPMGACMLLALLAEGIATILTAIDPRACACVLPLFTLVRRALASTRKRP